MNLKVDRRRLLIGGGSAVGLVLAWSVWPRARNDNLATGKDETALGAFLKIGTDNRVIVAVPQVETGQGIWTGLPQILADALGADWRMIGVEPAPLGAAYANHPLIRSLRTHELPGWAGPAGRLIGHWPDFADELQATVGSNSIIAFHQQFAAAGTVARGLLLRAAAKSWGTDWKTLQVRGGQVLNGAERKSFGALAAAAAGLKPLEAVPPPQTSLLGRPLPRLDAPPKTDGSARFGADVRLPRMVYAALRAGPPGDSHIVSADEGAARKMRGVVDVVRREDWIAVIGESWWAANHALNLAKPRFETRGVIPSDASITAALEKALADDAAAADAESRGDIDAAFKGQKPLTAEYAVPWLAHASPETPNATVRIGGGRCEIWIATQSPTLVREAVAQATGFSADDIIVYPTMVGGGFGRLLDPQVAVRAVLIAQAVDRPVQLVLSRWDDIVGDAGRVPMRARMQAVVGADKTITGWRAQIAAPDTASAVAATLLGRQARPRANADAIAGAVPPYAIPAMKVAHHLADVGLAPGLWRSGTHSATAFFNECFIDELSAAAGLDPLSFRLRMLKDRPRHAEALKTAAGLGNYAPVAGEMAQGLAVHESAGSVVAMMAQVRLDKGKAISVERMVCAVDCGQVVNPRLVRQQIEGGVIFALAAVTGAQVHWDAGIPREKALGALGLPLLADAPRVEVHLMKGTGAPSGVSGIAVPPVAPAVANAMFAASGQRVRHLPISFAGGPA